MSRGGRPPRAIPGVRKAFYLSQPTVAAVELLLLDPSRQKFQAKYGDWSRLVDSLLAEWVAKQQKAPVAVEAGSDGDAEGTAEAAGVPNA